MFYACIFLFVAPSAAPKSITTSDVTSSSITVHWEEVECIHRNGNITGYSLQYEKQGSGSKQTVNKQTVNVSGGATTEVTISRLQSSTAYIIEVAAVNSAGTGMYSRRSTFSTLGEE